MTKKISLAHMKPDRKARIAEITGGHDMRQRLMNMGVYQGREVMKLSHIGLRGPVVIKAGRAVIAVGHGMADKILVETE